MVLTGLMKIESAPKAKSDKLQEGTGREKVPSPPFVSYFLPTYLIGFTIALDAQITTLQEKSTTHYT